MTKPDSRTRLDVLQANLKDKTSCSAAVARPRPRPFWWGQHPSVLLAVGTGPAWADCPPDPFDPLSGVCLRTPSLATRAHTDARCNPRDTGNGPPGPACPGAPGGVCVNDYGYVWIGPPHNCYGFPLDPQPGSNSPLWRGKTLRRSALVLRSRQFPFPRTCGSCRTVRQSSTQAGGTTAWLRVAPFELANATIAPPRPTTRTSSIRTGCGFRRASGMTSPSV